MPTLDQQIAPKLAAALSPAERDHLMGRIDDFADFLSAYDEHQSQAALKRVESSRRHVRIMLGYDPADEEDQCPPA